MKRFPIFVLLAALVAMVLAACGDSGTGSNSGGSGEYAEAFLPTSYGDKEVSAWYLYQEVQNDNSLRTMAIFCFSDGSGVATVHRINSDGRETKNIEGEFEYEIKSGDFTTGKVVVKMQGSSITVDISKGVMTSDFFEDSYAKQDNSKVPAASEAVEGWHAVVDSNYGKDVEAFFPSSCARKNVVAWYLYEVERSQSQVKLEAVFLFDDNTLVVTKHKVKSDGRETREIIYEGSWEMTRGDTANGVASIDGELGQMTVAIENGVLSAMGSSYVKQKNSAVPAASDPVDEGKGGDDSGSGKDDGGSGKDEGGEGGEAGGLGDIEAFFPEDCAKKNVLTWYFAEVENTAEQVKNEAVFLFDDGTLVVTKHKVKNDGRETREIVYAGAWELTTGDYENGVVSIDDGQMKATVADGKLAVEGMETVYDYMADAAVPKASSVLAGN